MYDDERHRICAFAIARGAMRDSSTVRTNDAATSAPRDGERRLRALSPRPTPCGGSARLTSVSTSVRIATAMRRRYLAAGYGGVIIIILLACPCNTGFAAVDDISNELLMEALAEFEERQLETPGF